MSGGFVGKRERGGFARKTFFRGGGGGDRNSFVKEGGEGGTQLEQVEGNGNRTKGKRLRRGY